MYVNICRNLDGSEGHPKKMESFLRFVAVFHIEEMMYVKPSGHSLILETFLTALHTKIVNKNSKYKNNTYMVGRNVLE